MEFLKNIRDVFVPKRCLHCFAIIPKHQIFLCTPCFLELELTDFLHYRNNPLEKLFLGQVEIEFATAIYFYRKDSPIQTLLKNLKYQGLQSFGLFAANNLINNLKTTHYFKNVDLVTIVPLHPKKEKKRGYNQMELFGKTIANSLQKPFYKDLLLKESHTISQTSKGKESRYKSVKNSFATNSTYLLHKKHILLIDDVATTGATLLACCRTLKQTFHANISIITIACVV